MMLQHLVLTYICNYSVLLEISRPSNEMVRFLRKLLGTREREREREERLIPTDLQRATYVGGQPNITA
ncbi:hypothetical protein VN97_g623 [Penicillium thymicola]|uniref:Uncharacterized protein n=1 Tax=Penicillium thymicola TaxID=293382 RepID=A0AAI9TTA8_PENTH|nr:hypothetical protein VN97_g623 [Penicillium thymicola]